MTVYDHPLAPAAPPEPLRLLRLLHTGVAAAALGLAAGLAVALLWSTPFGGRTLIEMSGSMSPTLAPGDVVVTRGISPLDARLGDVITFPDPEGSGRLLTHRVRDVSVVGTDVRFVTQGDANTSAERWSVPASGRLGRVAYRVPLLGFALVWTTGTRGKIAFTVVPVLLAAFLALRRIWRS